MNVLLLDQDESRRQRIVDALAMIDSGIGIVSVSSLAEAEDLLTSYRQHFSLALVGPDLPENSIPTVRFLRRLSPETRVAAYDSYGLYEEVHLQRILLAGANMVFDIRMAPLKIALLMRPMLSSISSGLKPGILAA